MNPACPAIRLRGIRKSFGATPVLRGIDLDVATGEVLVVLGPSGSGKSTLLRCINQLETIDAGTVMLGQEQVGYALRHGRIRPLPPRAVARQRARIGMVFQAFNLYPHMTALQNVMEAPIGVHGRPRAEAEREARALLTRVGLAERAAAYPAALSGGQQQRVAIARALAIHPALLLFDEPTSALDPELVGEVLSVMRDLAGQGLTMIVVTHEMGFARQVADRVVFMDQGEVVEEGPPATLFAAPRTDRLRAFLSQIGR